MTEDEKLYEVLSTLDGLKIEACPFNELIPGSSFDIAARKPWNCTEWSGRYFTWGIKGSVGTVYRICQNHIHAILQVPVLCKEVKIS